jgi:hypothetical protein
MTSIGPTPTPPYLVRTQKLPCVRRSLAISNGAACWARARTEPTRATRQLASGTSAPQTPAAGVQHTRERTVAGGTWRAPAGCLREARGVCTWSTWEPPPPSRTRGSAGVAAGGSVAWVWPISPCFARFSTIMTGSGT